MTADLVCRILSGRCQGIAIATLAQTHTIALTTVKVWCSEKRWASDDLAARLAKMPDYESFREALDRLAKALGLTTCDLPPPARPRLTMDARKLKAALERLVDMQASRGPGYSKEPRVLETVGEEVGCAISHWVTANGRLKKPVGAVVRLDGYDELREELHRLFVDLKQPQTAEHLLVSGAASIKKLTVAMFIEALTAMAADRCARLHHIAATLGIDGTTLDRYLARNGSFRDFGTIRKMPDYGQNREALGAALRALGHDDQADNLPLAQIDAARLLRALRSDFGGLTAAMKILRRNPTLSIRDTAIRVKVPPEVLSAVSGHDGAVRDRDAVFELLTRFKPYMMKGIDEQLGRLNTASLDTQHDADAGTAMATLEFPGRGTIPAKVFVVRASTVDPGPNAKNRLEKIYANNPDLVREPRPFEAERPRQALRWLSTILKEAYPDAREIQCYYYARNREIIVSSNVSGANRRLAAELAQGGLIRIIESLCERGVEQGKREARHLEKLLVTLPTPPAKGKPRLFTEVLTAMSGSRFRVPMQSFSEDSRHVALHAERRIRLYLQHEFGEQTVDRRLLAGTMRPCGTCAEDLGFDDTQGRGPFWRSRPAQALIDAPRVLERNIRNGIGTYVTKTREGKVTIDYNTDSDSDIEQTELRMQDLWLRGENVEKVVK